MRTQDMGWSFRHSSRITNLLECVFKLDHFICTWVGSNPFKVIPLLDYCSPCRGNIYYFRYRERSRRWLILEADFEESRVVVLMVFGITCIRMW